MDRKLWKVYFSDLYTPRYPCPRCERGHLTRHPKSTYRLRPAYVTFDMYEEDPSTAPERFVMFLRCTEPLCGEVVTVAGDVSPSAEQGSEGETEWVDYFVPHSMKPAPPIFPLPKQLPPPVRGELILSFELFWIDTRVCASRVRTAMERLMDHFKVAKTTVVARPGKSGKRRRLDLSARIDKLPKRIGSSDYSTILHALRELGNLGTHGDAIKRATMLDAYRLCEIALTKLFEDESETAEAIIKRIKAKKK
jgi:hypothetical protein